MSRPLLPDSSWYIREAREGRDPLRELAKHADTRDIAVCGVVVAEVGRGIRKPAVLQQFRRAWDEMLYIETTRTVWRNVADLAWQLDRKGCVLPLQDVVIAACALSTGAVLLTLDRHYETIPGLVSTSVLY